MELTYKQNNSSLHLHLVIYPKQLRIAIYVSVRMPQGDHHQTNQMWDNYKFVWDSVTNTKTYPETVI